MFSIVPVNAFLLSFSECICSSVVSISVWLCFHFHLVIAVLTCGSFNRMAPATRTNPNREGEQSNPPDNPPPPPPPPEAWQAMMAASAANTQMLLQLMESMRNQNNQGPTGNFQHQNQFATLNQFLANQPKTFSCCDKPLDADDWLRDMRKHFECSNVNPQDYVKFASFQLKDLAAEWWQ